jgi:hypothetical protein
VNKKGPEYTTGRISPYNANSTNGLRAKRCQVPRKFDPIELKSSGIAQGVEPNWVSGHGKVSFGGTPLP